jgi:hypothetical protein
VGGKKQLLGGFGVGDGERDVHDGVLAQGAINARSSPSNDKRRCNDDLDSH